MNVAYRTRREFLADSGRAAAAGWLTLGLPWIATIAGCAREDARKDSPTFVTLTPAEGRAMRAFAAQIIPSDDGTPGAEEAGAVYFVDRALGTPFFADRLPVVRAGLAELDARARALDAKSNFASFPASTQTMILRQIEGSPFFASARTLVVMGTLADPSYGGNRDGAGWRMIGFDHQPSYTTPFGWYDAQTGVAGKPNAA